MKFVCFRLSGETALWRNVYEAIGSFSCLGPAPSALAGLCGAALGFPSPRSQGEPAPDVQALKKQAQGGLQWPVSPQLLEWEKANDCHVACRWRGGMVRRIAWNVNGIKDIHEPENLRMQQQLVSAPDYDVVIRLTDAAAASELAEALSQPAFRLYLGCSCCPAIVREIQLQDEFQQTGGNWAFHVRQNALGEATPLTRHRVGAAQSFDRLAIDGYWIYPTPEMPGVTEADPLTATYCE